MLIGFHRLKKRHMGCNIARTILYLLDWANIMHKVFIPYCLCGLIFTLQFRLATSLSTTLRTTQQPWRNFSTCWPDVGWPMRSNLTIRTIAFDAMPISSISAPPILLLPPLWYQNHISLHLKSLSTPAMQLTMTQALMMSQVVQTVMVTATTTTITHWNFLLAMVAEITLILRIGSRGLNATHSGVLGG